MNQITYTACRQVCEFVTVWSSLTMAKMQDLSDFKNITIGVKTVPVRYVVENLLLRKARGQWPLMLTGRLAVK